MDIYIIAGLDEGDIGKGLAVDYLTARKKALCVIPNGISGRQYEVDDMVFGKHMFKCLSAGSLNGAVTWFPGTCLVDPFEFVKDWFELLNKHHVKVIPMLSDTIMFHIPAERILEEALKKPMLLGDIRSKENPFTVRRYLDLTENARKSWWKKTITDIVRRWESEVKELPETTRRDYFTSFAGRCFTSNMLFMSKNCRMVDNFSLKAYESVIFELEGGIFDDESLFPEKKSLMKTSASSVLPIINWMYARCGLGFLKPLNLTVIYVSAQPELSKKQKEASEVDFNILKAGLTASVDFSVSKKYFCYLQKSPSEDFDWFSDGTQRTSVRSVRDDEVLDL